MSPPNARNQPAVAVRLAAPKYAHKQAEALLRQLKTASTAVTSTANQSLSSAKQLDLIGSLFARVSAVYAASPTEAFPIVSKILSHVGSVELPSLREKIGEVDVGRREALQSKQEAWSFAQMTDLSGKQVLGNECFAALVDLFQKCDSIMVRRRILDVFDTGIQGGVESNKKMLVENPLFVELSGKMFAEASDQGLVERLLDITIRLVKATKKGWIDSVFDVGYYSGDEGERDYVRAEFEKVDLKNYDEGAAFMTALSNRKLTNFQPIFLLRLSSNKQNLSNCDGDSDGKEVTFGESGHFNRSSFTVVTTKEVGSDYLQQILEVEYPFKRIIVDVSSSKPASVTIFADRIKLDSVILALPVDQAGNSTITFSIKSSDVDTLKRILDARNLAFETRGNLAGTVQSTIPTKRTAVNQAVSTKGKQTRKEGIASTRVATAPGQATQVSKIAVAVLKPTTPQKSVQFSSPAAEAVQASSGFVYPLPTQRRDFLTAGVESSSSTEARRSLVDFLPSQKQLSIRSSQIIVKPKVQKRHRESCSQNIAVVKKQKKQHRRSEPRIVEVESSTEDRLSAALGDLFSMISKSVGQTSIRTRKTKSTFELWATRKATEIERENHHQTGLTLQNMQQIIRRIHESNDRARHEIYEIQKSMGGEENGGAI